MRFFDASALVKRYVRERESTAVRRLLRDGEVAVSRLSEVEVASALARLVRDGAITKAQRDRAVAALVADLATWHVVELVPEVTTIARRLLADHPLRAGDAVQIGSALVLRARLAEGLETLVAYDQRVLDAARAEHLAVAGQ